MSKVIVIGGIATSNDEEERTMEGLDLGIQMKICEIKPLESELTFSSHLYGGLIEDEVVYCGGTDHLGHSDAARRCFPSHIARMITARSEAASAVLPAKYGLQLEDVSSTASSITIYLLIF